MLAGFVHVSFKCSECFLDSGHFEWKSKEGVFNRAPPTLNNTHQIEDGLGLLDQGELADILKEFDEGDALVKTEL